MTKNAFMKKFEQAESFFAQGNYEEASKKYMSLTGLPEAAPLAYYRIAAISNIAGDPTTAKNLYYKAFELKPDIARYILPKDHPNHDYVFGGKIDEELFADCMFCGKKGTPRWCYPVIEMGSAHVRKYNPVRLWLYCVDCQHMWAEEFPPQSYLVGMASGGEKPVGMPTRTQLFSIYSEILNKITQFVQSDGNELLEVGIGAGECALAAAEMGFNVYGIDISKGNIEQAKRYGLNADMMDFMDFESEKKWDIIILGDVIEHVPDPLLAMQKLGDILAKDGAIWISTPNFESAFSMYAGHNDPMRKEASHRHYFSRQSMFKLLDRYGFMPVDYKISMHYNGSMEVIAVKRPV